MLALYQPHFHTLPNDLLEQLLKQLRLLKPSVPVLREGGVMRDLLIETQAREPAPRQVRATPPPQLHSSTPAMGSVHLERRTSTRLPSNISIQTRSPIPNNVNTGRIFQYPRYTRAKSALSMMI